MKCFLAVLVILILALFAGSPALGSEIDLPVEVVTAHGDTSPTLGVVANETVSVGVGGWGFSGEATAGTTQSLFFTAHIPPQDRATIRKEEITPYIIWARNAATPTAGTYVWALEYKWVTPGETESASTTTTETLEAATAVRKFTKTSFPKVDVPSSDAVFMGRIYRKAWSSDDTSTATLVVSTVGCLFKRE